MKLSRLQLTFEDASRNIKVLAKIRKNGPRVVSRAESINILRVYFSLIYGGAGQAGLRTAFLLARSSKTVYNVIDNWKEAHFSPTVGIDANLIAVGPATTNGNKQQLEMSKIDFTSNLRGSSLPKDKFYCSK